MRKVNLPKTATITDICLTRALRRAGPLSQAALAALAYDLYHGWPHACAVIGVTGMIPHGERCVWCDSQDPTEPKGAA